MGCVFGNLYTVTVFGESHSAGLGVVIGGLPPGTPLDVGQIEASMQRRAPSGDVASTARREADAFEILCGYINGHTTGTPLAAVLRNTDTRSQDYLQTAALLRPGHADYTGYIKYRGYNDIRGGGHFSGRLTAPLVFAGAAARQVLALSGIVLGAHIASVADIQDRPFHAFDSQELCAPEQHAMQLLDQDAAERMQECIAEAKRNENSVGGTIECAAIGLPAGLGDPFFDSVESVLSHVMFSIPGIKGIEFGDGFGLTRMLGSEANDSPVVRGGRVSFCSNHSGGVAGGITNGMPLVFRVAVRPTASISQPQPTVDIRRMENDVLRLRGRHDACIVPRAVEVVKCAAAVVLLDLLLQERAYTDGGQ